MKEEGNLDTDPTTEACILSPKPGKKSEVVLYAEHRLISPVRNRVLECILCILDSLDIYSRVV
jgi:hypothetical protein